MKFRFGFYRIDDVNVIPRIVAQLNIFARNPRPLDNSRCAEISAEHSLLLRSLNNEVDGDYLLDFSKLRNIVTMDLSDASANEEEFRFDDRKPAEFTTGVFDSRTGVLMLQEHSHAASAASVAKYWRKILLDEIRPHFHPVLELRGLEELLRGNRLSGISFKIANMGDPAELERMGFTHAQILSLRTTFNAPTIELSMTLADLPPEASRTRTDYVLNLIDQLTGLGTHTEKVKILTTDNEDEEMAINLLNDRMQESVEYSVDEIMRMGGDKHAIRYRAVREAWNSRKVSLRTRF